MAKDYAKRVFTTSSRKPKKKRLRIEVFILLFIFIVVGAGYGIYKYSMTENGTFLMRIQSVLKRAPLAKVKPTATAQTKNKADPDIHFDFYNELPNMQVVISDSSDSEPAKIVQKITPAPIAKAAATPASTTTVPQYIVQLGVFKDQAGASQTRLSLLLSGCEADVVKVSGGEGLVYRLQNGPFNKLTEAKMLQQKLQRKGISSVVKKFG